MSSLAAETHFGLPSTQCTCSVVRGERHKYVHFPALPAVLFDVIDDPDEQHNLADDPRFLSERLACAEQLLGWLSTSRDESLALMQLGPTIPEVHRHAKSMLQL